jgi:hypothetical protein
MTSGVFLSTASVAAIMAGVALLALLSALTLVPFGRYERRYIVAFWVCLVAIWVGAVFIMVLIRRAV